MIIASSLELFMTINLRKFVGNSELEEKKKGSPEGKLGGEFREEL